MENPAKVVFFVDVLLGDFNLYLVSQHHKAIPFCKGRTWKMWRFLVCFKLSTLTTP